MKRILLATLIALVLLLGLTNCMEVVEPTSVDIEAQGLGSRPHVPYMTAMSITASADTWYILVDLSDNQNYPHANTNQIVLKGWRIAGDLSDAHNWHWCIGVLTENDATDGSVDCLFTGARVRAAQFDERWMAAERGMNLSVVDGDTAFMLTNAAIDDVAAITTSAILACPAGTDSPGVGDLMLFLDEITGTATIHFSVDVMYDTE